VKPLGQGTERVEDALRDRFPHAPLLRFDRDVVRHRGELVSMLDRVAAGDARILVGTQMLTKGHDFPDVTLVVIVHADQGLFSADFRASERLSQTIVQVSGRAGRAARPGEVLIQTEFPEHPLLRSLLDHGYDGFAEAALEERRCASWPPYSRLALLRADAPRLEEAMQFLHEARAAGEPLADGVELLGPVAATMARRAGRFNAQLLAQSASRAKLQRFLSNWVTGLEETRRARVHWSVDVDPNDLY
jgi:primosomal protein N' (replication factor Y)